jgi:hypothetical protein
MSLALCAPAFAADKKDGDLESDGIVGDFTTPDVTREDEFTKAVIMYKEITAYNPETTNIIVNAPTITYNYTIAAGESGKDIYDAKNNHLIGENTNVSAHVQTKAGVGTPTIQGSVNPKAQSPTWKDNVLEFTPNTATFEASSAGAKNSFPLKIGFDGIDYTTDGTGAGVYRYVITETVTAPTTGEDDSANKAAAGIKDGSISDTRYLDVYVNGDGEIYGWVCFAYNKSIDAREAADGGETNNAVDKAYKTEGFVAGTDKSSGTDTAVTADAYYTFNFEVTKTVEKDNYSITTAHQFPFTITLDNPNVTAQVLPIMKFTEDFATGTSYVETSTKVTQTSLSALVIGTSNNKTIWNPTISHNTAVKYIGIPCGTTVTINEKNNVPSVSYAAAISGGAETKGETKAIFYNEDSNNAVISGTTHLQPATKNYTGSTNAVTFTNALLEISPTGVALRYAPYLAMMGAGIVALPLSLRKKEEEI